ncbi:MAG: sulfurtransferase, partial [Pseudolabrys sp.]|nr:sulfurtransferase [Pseudolabrys sp.]
MLSPSYSMLPTEVWPLIGTARAPHLIDVRRREAFDQSPHLLPVAIWRDAGAVQQWSPTLDRTRPIVVACKAGHEMSQMAVAQ